MVFMVSNILNITKIVADINKFVYSLILLNFQQIYTHYTHFVSQ